MKVYTVDIKFFVKAKDQFAARAAVASWFTQEMQDRAMREIPKIESYALADTASVTEFKSWSPEFSFRRRSK